MVFYMKMNLTKWEVEHIKNLIGGELEIYFNGGEWEVDAKLDRLATKFGVE